MTAHECRAEPGQDTPARAAARLLLDRTRRIANEVGDDAMNVICISHGAYGFAVIETPFDVATSSQPLDCGLLNDRRKADTRRVGNAGLRATIAERRFSEVYGALNGPLEARRGAFHAGILGLGQAFRHDLSSSERVTEVMVDLGDRLAELG